MVVRFNIDRRGGRGRFGRSGLDDEDRRFQERQANRESIAQQENRLFDFAEQNPEFFKDSSAFNNSLDAIRRGEGFKVPTQREPFARLFKPFKSVPGAGGGGGRLPALRARPRFAQQKQQAPQSPPTFGFANPETFKDVFNPPRKTKVFGADTAGTVRDITPEGGIPEGSKIIQTPGSRFVRPRNKVTGEIGEPIEIKPGEEFFDFTPEKLKAKKTPSASAEKRETLRQNAINAVKTSLNPATEKEFESQQEVTTFLLNQGVNPFESEELINEIKRFPAKDNFDIQESSAAATQRREALPRSVARTPQATVTRGQGTPLPGRIGGNISIQKGTENNPFGSSDEADRANLPSGTVIFIRDGNRIRKAVVE